MPAKKRKSKPAKQPQCAALKDDGTRCKRPSTSRSKYCASHKGWRPKGTAKKKLDALKKAREMRKVRNRAAKTPGGTGPVRNRKAAVKVMGARARCAAITGGGSQCKRVPRQGSKYCATHKGYRPRSRPAKR